MREKTVKKYKIIIERYDKEFNPEERNGKRVINEIAEDLCLSKRTVQNIVYESRYTRIVKENDLSSL
jgi:ribosomal protein S17E